jgi:hypothetical protein
MATQFAGETDNLQMPSVADMSQGERQEFLLDELVKRKQEAGETNVSIQDIESQLGRTPMGGNKIKRQLEQRLGGGSGGGSVSGSGGSGGGGGGSFLPSASEFFDEDVGANTEGMVEAINQAANRSIARQSQAMEGAQQQKMQQFTGRGLRRSGLAAGAATELSQQKQREIGKIDTERLRDLSKLGQQATAQRQEYRMAGLEALSDEALQRQGQELSAKTARLRARLSGAGQQPFPRGGREGGNFGVAGRPIINVKKEDEGEDSQEPDDTQPTRQLLGEDIDKTLGQTESLLGPATPENDDEYSPYDNPELSDDALLQNTTRGYTL